MFIFLLLIASYLSIIEGKYASGVFVYEDLACKPVISSGKVVRYECPPLKRSNGTCQFKDKEYPYGGKLEDEFFRGSCTAFCNCGENGNFYCAVSSCQVIIQEGCSHHKYSLDNCCPVGSVCGNYKVCEISGKKYKEGERYYLDDTCEECICEEDPKCRKRRCYINMLPYKHELGVGAAVFFKEDSCCPSDWTTYENEEIIKINQEIPEETDLFCTSGEKKVKLGYGFDKILRYALKEEKFRCECSLPPLLFCTKQ